MKQIILLLLFSIVVQINAQELPQFTYKDDSGCTFVFQLEEKDGRNVALISATNKNKPRLEIPASVSNKSETYTVTRIAPGSLKKLDKKIKELVFPETVQTIGSFLFESPEKYFGGYYVSFKGSSVKSSLAGCMLQRLTIPESVQFVGDEAFITEMSNEGGIMLDATIEELPAFITSWNAVQFGLKKKDVTEYWQKNGNEITQDEYLAALESYKDNIENSSESTDNNQIQESSQNEESALSTIVEQVINREDPKQQELLKNLRISEEAKEYNNAIQILDQLSKYTSDPHLSYVKTIWYYKIADYNKCCKEGVNAYSDGRLDGLAKEEIFQLVANAFNLQLGIIAKKLERIDMITNALQGMIPNVVNSIMANKRSTASLNLPSSSITTSNTTYAGSPKATISAKRIRCPKCNGSGKCISCQGTGKRTKHYKKNGEWHDTIDCPQCDGSGCCRICEGGKWIESEDISSPTVSSTTSTNSSSTPKTYRTCTWCNGKGSTIEEHDAAKFGLIGKEDKKGKCPECGAQLYKGRSHTHIKCRHCSGTGKLEN